MNTTNPLVSIIIPAYNHEDYVQDAIQSALAQTYQNIELLIIDDGSKDDTWQKICEMEDICKTRFVNLILKTKENSGTCETLNMLLKNSTGEYVFLLASDDLVKPHAIEKQVEFLANNLDYALVVGDNEIINGNNERVYWDKKRNIHEKESAKYHSFGEFLRSTREDVDFLSDDFGSYATLFKGNYIPNGYFIRKSIFEKIGYFTKEAPLEDWWLMLQISKYAKLKYIDEIFFSYRWHDTNTMKQKEKMRSNTLKTLQYEQKIIEQINVSECKESFKNFLESGVEKKRTQIFMFFEFITIQFYTHKVKILKLGNRTLFNFKQDYKF